MIIDLTPGQACALSKKFGWMFVTFEGSIDTSTNEVTLFSPVAPETYKLQDDWVLALDIDGPIHVGTLDDNWKVFTKDELLERIKRKELANGKGN